ncbi:Epoxide hydrolase EphB (epoxide hydratase) [Mycobacterium tuberculosis]|nr:Epoxide hydrolase EphB (epoxide hydratase) [Mycobacterium tuberculosis]
MSQVHRILNCRGTRIHAVADSPPDQQGPLVVLLHGFPESWYSTTCCRYPVRGW